MAKRYFTAQTFDFLTALAANNQRNWFQENRARYEETVRQPALDFIRDMSTDLAMISPHFVALPKKVGGSLMRVNRDIRFGKNKRPYKTNIGIQFRHERGKDVHAPGFYLHIEKGACFVGVGIWQPDARALSKVRDAIIENGDGWLAARDNKAFADHFALSGSALKTYPRGYDKHHPLISDLRRKEFIAIADLRHSNITSTTLLPRVANHFSQATPLMHFLCKALDLRF
ncbi:MAG: DUF2461 domain-containing protein [Gammaproteobacteria bacterium]|nr:DUF2461 domain-containing protein [Gammaproteobacteria bacterium]MCF6229800.1 DUF2461 domain-containing protein [Gammaproteobacteria bacterium]